MLIHKLLYYFIFIVYNLEVHYQRSWGGGRKQMFGSEAKLVGKVCQTFTLRGGVFVFCLFKLTEIIAGFQDCTQHPDNSNCIIYIISFDQIYKP